MSTPTPPSSNRTSTYSNGTVTNSSPNGSGGITERTLALLTSREALGNRTHVESILIGAGFDIVAETKVKGEEIEGWGFVEGRLEPGSGPFLLLCLERRSAFAVWREISNSTSEKGLRASFPPNSFHSPAVPALAVPAIARFFPDLPPLNCPLPSPESEMSKRTVLNVSNLPGEEIEVEHEEGGDETDVTGEMGVGQEEEEEDDEEEEEMLEGEELAEEEYLLEEEVVELEEAEEESGDPTTPTVSRAAPRPKLRPSSSSTSNDPNGSSFRARPLPSTHLKPSHKPRMSRAAALRMGLAPPEEPRVRRKSQPDAPDMITPGVNQRPLLEGEKPKSLAKPAFAPRMTRAAALRAGGPEAAAAAAAGKRDRRASAPASASVTPTKDKDENLPGIKKRALAPHELPKSLGKPSIVPRTTRAAALRRGDALSPSPTRGRTNLRREGSEVSLASLASMRSRSTGTPGTPSGGDESPTRERRPVDFENTPGHKRILSVQVGSLKAPSITPRGTKSSLMRAGGQPSTPSSSHSRTATVTGTPSTAPRVMVSYEGVPGHKRRDTMQVKSTMAPSITPRTTKASQLRTGGGGSGGSTNGQASGSSVSLPRTPSSSSIPSQATTNGSQQLSLDDDFSPRGSSTRSASNGSSTGKGGGKKQPREKQPPNFDGIPGHKRRESLPVASTKAPSIAPRQTKASQLRTGGSSSVDMGSIKSTPGRKQASLEGLVEEEEGEEVERRPVFDGIPGHRRVGRIEVASTKAPSIAPRMSKAAQLRQMTGGATEPRTPKSTRSWSRDDLPQQVEKLNGNGSSIKQELSSFSLDSTKKRSQPFSPPLSSASTRDASKSPSPSEASLSNLPPPTIDTSSAMLSPNASESGLENTLPKSSSTFSVASASSVASKSSLPPFVDQSVPPAPSAPSKPPVSPRGSKVAALAAKWNSGGNAPVTKVSPANDVLNKDGTVKDRMESITNEVAETY